MEQNGMGESDSDGASAKPPSKRPKNKSKVWEKVAWFARRSRHRDDNLSVVDHLRYDEGAADVCFDCEMDLASPLGMSSTCQKQSANLGPWVLESSSSNEELSEDYDSTRCLSRHRRLYPNSEVVVQNCLKPSVARALFHQLELASRNSDSPRVISSKAPWQKRKKKTTYSAWSGNGRKNMFSKENDTDFKYESNFRTRDSTLKHCNSLNMYDSSVSKEKECLSGSAKHCACCRVNRHAAHHHHAHVERNLSTKSLDRFYAHRIHFQSRLLSSHDGQAALLQKSGKPKTPSTDAQHAQCQNNNQISSANPYQSSSLPNYFSKSLHDRVQCWGSERSHLPICETVYNSAVSSDINVCRCSNVEENGSATGKKIKEVVHKTDIKVQPDVFKMRLQTMKSWFGEFSDEQKNLLLKEILENCELPQIHLLSLKMSPRLHDGCPPNCEDLITWLPKSLALYIMSYLDPVNLCRASQVCRAWYQLANEPCLWRRFSCLGKWRLSRTGEQKQLIQHMLPNETVHWKRVFAERYKLRHNWLKGRCNVRTFEGHTQGISCVQFDDTRIVSGSSDKTIKVWNIRTNTPWSVQTLVGHSGTVRCLHLEGNRLVSGSTDKSIKVWDLSTQQSWSSIACKVTMVGHSDTVRCLQVDDEKVISGSYDKTLKIWDVRTGNSRRTLRGHDGAVLCVQFDCKKIISGSSDKTIKVWNFEGDCIMTLHGHHDAVTCLQFDQTRIVSGSLDSTLKFWDITTGQCINTIDWKASEGHTGVVRCLQADSWRVISASDDRTLKVWNITTGERLVTLRNHSDGVTCLQFNDNMIVSGSYDKTVKLWDFSCC